MGVDKTNITSVKNIFNSLSSKELTIILQKSNAQISESIDKLSKLYAIPRELLTSNYEETNGYLNSIISIENKNWFVPLSEISSDLSENENLSSIVNLVIEIKEEFKTYYSKIIRDIQYHDIIKQKLEHIIEINNDIEKEINILNSGNYQQDNKKLKYLEAIKEIINIEIAQLIYSSELCKASIERITNAFEGQITLINKTKTASGKMQENINKVIKRIETDTTLAEQIASNSKKYSVLNQANLKNIGQEISEFLPNEENFEKNQKNYKSQLLEIENLSTSESSFFEILQNIVKNIKNARERLFKDSEGQNTIKENNLDFLKKKYTMSSEYKIHQLTLENELIKDFFSEMSEPEQNNDVEFF